MRNTFCVIMMKTAIMKIYDFHNKCPISISCYTHLTLNHAHVQGVQMNVTRRISVLQMTYFAVWHQATLKTSA